MLKSISLYKSQCATSIIKRPLWYLLDFQLAIVRIMQYTGSVNIPIPIYTINLDGKNFPITLSYQSSGTKVVQEAS